MKSLLTKLLFLGLLLAAPSAAHAQLGDFFEAVRDVAREGLSPARLGTKPVHPQHLAGTYAYTSPVLVFESQSIASQLGAAMAATEIKEKLATAYAKAGIAPQKLLLTFKADGKYTAHAYGETIEGTYALNGATLTLNIPYSTAKVPLNVLQDGHELQLAVKADKLFPFVQGLSSVTTSAQGSLNALSTLLKGYSGLQVGMVMRRQ